MLLTDEGSESVGVDVELVKKYQHLLKRMQRGTKDHFVFNIRYHGIKWQSEKH